MVKNYLEIRELTVLSREWLNRYFILKINYCSLNLNTATYYAQYRHSLVIFMVWKVKCNYCHYKKQNKLIITRISRRASWIFKIIHAIIFFFSKESHRQTPWTKESIQVVDGEIRRQRLKTVIDLNLQEKIAVHI